jgi:hypothetical protein
MRRTRFLQSLSGAVERFIKKEKALKEEQKERYARILDSPKGFAAHLSLR